MKAFLIDSDREVTNGLVVKKNAFGKFGLTLGGVKYMVISKLMESDVISDRILNLHTWIQDGRFLTLYRQDPTKMESSDTFGIIVVVRDSGFLEQPILGNRSWLQNTHKLGGNEVLTIMKFNEEGAIVFRIDESVYLASSAAPGLLAELSRAEFSVIEQKSAGGKNYSRTLSRQVISYLKKKVDEDKAKTEGSLETAMKKALKEAPRGGNREDQLDGIAQELINPGVKPEPTGDLAVKLAQAMKKSKPAPKKLTQDKRVGAGKTKGSKDNKSKEPKHLLKVA